MLDFDWVNAALNFKFSQVTVLRKRPDANSHCDSDLHNDDLQFMIKASEKVGCIPLYWKHIIITKIKMEICNDPESMEQIWKLTQNFSIVHSLYDPPCNEMKTVVTYQQQKIVNYWYREGFRFLEIKFSYLDKSYQEVVNEREFGFESLWSTVGGFIGIFIGTSLSQVPHLLGVSWTWIRSVKEKFK